MCPGTAAKSRERDPERGHNLAGETEKERGGSGVGVSGFNLFFFPVEWGTPETVNLFRFFFFPFKTTVCVQLQGQGGRLGGEKSREPLPDAGTRGPEPAEPLKGVGQGPAGAAGRAAFAAAAGLALPGAGVTRVVRGRTGHLRFSFSCSH